eukprot:355334-Chlamydomonas_euryale.AAC.5
MPWMRVATLACPMCTHALFTTHAMLHPPAAAQTTVGCEQHLTHDSSRVAHLCGQLLLVGKREVPSDCCSFCMLTVLSALQAASGATIQHDNSSCGYTALPLPAPLKDIPRTCTHACFWSRNLPLVRRTARVSARTSG